MRNYTLEEKQITKIAIFYIIKRLSKINTDLSLKRFIGYGIKDKEKLNDTIWKLYTKIHFEILDDGK
jgi:hypothetical protein